MMKKHLDTTTAEVLARLNKDPDRFDKRRASRTRSVARLQFGNIPPSALPEMKAAYTFDPNEAAHSSEIVAKYF
jgi:hypothetical protein